MKKPKILINALSVKKISGGVFQVSINFIKASLEDEDIEWIYFLSADIANALKELGYTKIRNSHVFPTQPDFKRSYWKVRKQTKELELSYEPDIVYSLASPSYFKFIAPEVMRFTNPWVTHPNKYSWSVLDLKQKVRTALYIFNQKRLLRKRRLFITQTEFAKKGILKITNVPPENVCVVPNVLPKAYLSEPSNSEKNTDGVIDIITCSAPHVHKNLDIIPEIIDILNKEYHIKNVRFHLTLDETTPLYKAIVSRLEIINASHSIINHGYLNQKQLASLYRQCDIMFMPTLLEVFSATLLEAMYFKLAIVTTDLDFNSDIAKDGALYYIPKDAASAAKQLASLINDMSRLNVYKMKSNSHLNNVFFDYDAYFSNTRHFLLSHIDSKL